MKRDLDLIRHILLCVEESNEIPTRIESMVTEKYSLDDIAYNITLLNDAGYVVLYKHPALESRTQRFYIERLTMAGCDYLDNVRDNKIWAKTKEAISNVAQSASLDVIKNIAGSLINAAIAVAGIAINQIQ